MDKTARLYLGLMAMAGASLGLADHMAPGWTGGVPSLLFLLGASLAFDVITNQMAANGRIAPLSFQGRVIGFLVGAAAALAIPWLGGAR